MYNWGIWLNHNHISSQCSSLHKGEFSIYTWKKILFIFIPVFWNVFIFLSFQNKTNRLVLFSKMLTFAMNLPQSPTWSLCHLLCWQFFFFGWEKDPWVVDIENEWAYLWDCDMPLVPWIVMRQSPFCNLGSLEGKT